MADPKRQRPRAFRGPDADASGKSSSIKTTAPVTASQTRSTSPDVLVELGSRERFLHALDGHPFKDRLLREPDLFLKCIPEYRRRQSQTYRRGAGECQIPHLRPEFDELRDRVAVLERQMLDLVNVMGN